MICRKALVFFILVLAVSGCSLTPTTKAELEKYINNPGHGLKQEIIRGKVTYQMAFRPAGLLKKTKIADREKAYLHFILSISANGKELLKQLPYNTYSEMVQVLAFRMPAFISAVNDEGIITTPDDCRFLQTYGLSKSNQLLLTFPAKNLLKSKRFHIKVNEFGLSSGNIAFDFDSSSITSLQQ